MGQAWSGALPYVHSGEGGEQLEALVQVVLPKSAGVDKGQLSVDTTCVHKNGQDLHKKVHLITIGLSRLFLYQNTLTLDLIPFHSDVT